MHVESATLELCSDVIISMTQLVPDFKILTRYDDLYSMPAFAPPLYRRI